jgi:hypothetical protein
MNRPFGGATFSRRVEAGLFNHLGVSTVWYVLHRLIPTHGDTHWQRDRSSRDSVLGIGSGWVNTILDET